jgi:hypothetical protein
MRIFGLKSDEVIGGWGKLCNEELHNDQFMENEMTRTCSTHEGDQECIQGICGKSRIKKTTIKI